MKPEDQNIAIAEACGLETFTRHDWDERDDRRDFVCLRCGDRIGLHNYSKELGNYNSRCVGDRGRNYTTDLNAMNEAEETLDFRVKIRDYYRELCNTTGGFPTFAKAAQRAEAFLRTIGKWTDTNP